MSVLLAQTINLGQINLYELIFETILKLERCSGLEGWGCWIGPEYFAHDFIYALFLPHVVLLVFLYIIGTTTFVFRAHRGLGALFSIAAYVFIIYAGWYAILASWLIFWLALTIIVSLGYFFITKFVHPAETKTRFAIGGKIAEGIKERRDRSNAIEELLQFRRDLERMKKDYEEDRKTAPADEKVELGKKIREIDEKIRDVNRRIKNFERM